MVAVSFIGGGIKNMRRKTTFLIQVTDKLFHIMFYPPLPNNMSVPLTFVTYIKHMLDDLLFMVYTFKADIRTHKNLEQRNTFVNMSLSLVIIFFFSVYCWKNNLIFLLKFP